MYQVQPDPDFALLKLKALGLEGMVQELLKYLRRAESQFSVSNFLETDIYNTVLHSLVQAKEVCSSYNLPD